MVAGAVVVIANAVSSHAEEPVRAVASFFDSHGSPSGSAKLTSLPAGGIFISLEISGLPAGKWVGLHVHETGKCDHTDGHQSASGHFNPTSKDHGFRMANGPHAGDFPNQYVSGDGILRAELFNAALSLDEKAETGIVGRALIVHANPDDYESQPSGNAGDRLACGVIE